MIREGTAKVVLVKNIRVALIPAYQPSAFLPALVKRFHDMDFSLVVVDDGSGEQYRDIFEQCLPYAAVLRHADNAGKGRALKTGLREIDQTYGQACTVVTVDADGQHRAEDAYAVTVLAEQNPFALVLGSRILNKQAPLRNRFGNAVTRFVFRLSSGYGVRDTQTGLRAFGGGLISEMLSIPGERYEYEMNVLLRFAREKQNIIECPIETIYLDGNASSHFDAVRDSARIYKEILKFSASSFLAFLVDYAVYGLLSLLGASLTVSNAVARLVSGTVNFTVNRGFVFQNRRSLVPAALKYAVLAASILVCNTCLLAFLVNRRGVNRMLAKVLTELCFFMISWLVQRLFVFQNRSGR